MNCKQAYTLGVASGLEASELGDFSPEELSDEGRFFEACSAICDNKRQYAGHPGYSFTRQPNCDALWDAFEKGEEVGARKGWRQRQKGNKTHARANGRV